MGPVGVSRSRNSLRTIIALSSPRHDTGEAGGGRTGMSRKVRWGVLGAARIARTKVIPALQRSQQCEVIALASRSLDNARTTAALLGIPRAYGSYEELLA